ncbi:hypothetical protein T492DRAFT_850606 [Pavlovales sp. CCMP2436]|nr:hypothetical protein T492DRAFT_850606 [Pavlovales sp. CCMP2436]
MRVERLRDTHPIWSLEAMLSAAIVEGDFLSARRHHSRLEDVRWNLGLPKFLVGQVVVNRQADFRAVIISVDITYQRSAEWLRKCKEANALVVSETEQPWYTMLVDKRYDDITSRELYTEQQNRYSEAARPPVYLPQDALVLCYDVDEGFQHDLAAFLFESATPQLAPDGEDVGLGLRLKPTIKLRLWQRAQNERGASYGSSI